MRIKRNLTAIALSMAFGVICVHAQYEDNWERVRGTYLPENSVVGGYEANGLPTYICRSQYRGDWVGGRVVEGRCYFATGRDERSETRFEVLTGPDREFGWRRVSSSERAVSTGKGAAICRVSDGGGLYSGDLKDGRCAYSRGGRGLTSRNYELLEGREVNVDIIAASENGNLEALRAAIRAGQMIDRRDDEGRTALMIASEKGYSALVDELIYQRASINARDNKGNTPLILASREGKDEVVGKLLQEGAEFGISNEDGKTALAIAAERGHVGVLRRLVDDRSFPGVESEESKKAFRISAANGKEDALAVFVEKGIDVDSQDQATGRTALMEAAGGKHGDSLKYLLRLTKMLFALDAEGYSAFEHAVLADSDKTIKVFTEEERLIGFRDSEAEYGLWTAARAGQRESLRYLLQSGVDVNARNAFDGFTALMWSAYEGRGDSTEILIQARADLNVQNENGETALMLAAANSKTNTLKELIKAGADLFIRDHNGRTALDWAIANRHSDTRKELEKAGAGRAQ